MISKDLGKMKLEAICKEAVFISPKVYGYITDTGKEIIKIKGFKDINNIFMDFVKLKFYIK